MNDRRRARVPWWSWRWRVGLLVPMGLFGWLAVESARGFGSHPAVSLGFGVAFVVLALIFARQVWRERKPLRTDVARRSWTGAGQLELDVAEGRAKPLEYALPRYQRRRSRWWLGPVLLLGAVALFLLYFFGYWWLFVGLDRGP